jgi:hypothetical protein
MQQAGVGTPSLQGHLQRFDRHVAIVDGAQSPADVQPVGNRARARIADFEPAEAHEDEAGDEQREAGPPSAYPVLSAWRLLR